MKDNQRKAMFAKQRKVGKYTLSEPKNGSKPKYKISFDEKIKLENDLRRKGYDVSFHPNHLEIATDMDYEDFKYRNIDNDVNFWKRKKLLK